MTQDKLRSVLEALRLARAAIEPLTEAQIKLHRIDRMLDNKLDCAIDAVSAHLQQRPLPVREEGVLVLLKRPEGYEDVHLELLLQDANINPAFEPEIVSRPLPVREGTDEEIIAIAKDVFGCEDICLSGQGERDREVTVCEYPIGEDAIKFARAVLAVFAPSVQNTGEGETPKDGVGGTDGR